MSHKLIDIWDKRGIVFEMNISKSIILTPEEKQL